MKCLHVSVCLGYEGIWQIPDLQLTAAQTRVGVCECMHTMACSYAVRICTAVGVPQIELAVAPASSSRRRRMQEGAEASACVPPFCISPDAIRNISKLAGASGKGGAVLLVCLTCTSGVGHSPGWELWLAMVG